MNWWQRLWAPKPKRTVRVEVGKATVTVTPDGGEPSSFSLVGSAIWCMHAPITWKATGEFSDMLDRWGKRRMAYLGGGRYVPLSKVIVSVKYEPHEVEVEIP